MARIYGNHSAAGFLEAQGHARPLSKNEQILAACAEGANQPGRLELGDLKDEDRCLLTTMAAEPGRLEQIKALVAAGLDPDWADSMGLPPLHIAGWNGLVPEMAYFLSLGPDLTRKNGYGGTRSIRLSMDPNLHPRDRRQIISPVPGLLLEAEVFFIRNL